ncbi:MAG: Uncharacterised protein [Acidimicrobiales bacterium AG-410-I20]|nr:MAG: Uncharacterised protein [Acidimicrobiales bacterium AG-410-I20]
MTHLGYLIAGWGIALIVFLTYVTSIFRRARSAAPRVPSERQRWMTSSEK